MSTEKIIFFMFAGREENMEVQRPHLERLLALYPAAELHLWDLTRRASDSWYIQKWAGEHSQIKYRGDFHTGHLIKCIGKPKYRGAPPCRCMIHRPPYEKPWIYYANGAEYADCTFVKLDDDVLWMDVPRFGEVLEFLETHPDEVASANVTNNVVCAKYEHWTLPAYLSDLFEVGDPKESENDKAWWLLHTDPIFADSSHRWLLDRISFGYVDSVDELPPVKTREGEAISINFVAMKHSVLKRAASLMRDNRLGDEGAIDTLLPYIVRNFRVAHLSFGPQEPGLALRAPIIREKYKALGEKE